MAGYGERELREDLRKWVRDDAIIARTAELLGGQAKLSESKIANWKRSDRELPDILVEGAALHYTAAQVPYDLNAAQRTGLRAKEFWQVFAISPNPGKTGNHDCVVARYWTGVERLAPENGPRDLSHRTWGTGPSAMD